ncbi:MAG: methyltransferase [Anaerolineae bacterium]
MYVVEPDQAQIARTKRWLSYEEIDLPDGSARLAQLPGVRKPGPAHTALFDAVRRVPPGKVFVAGPGAAASALWAARVGATVITWTWDVAEYLSVTETFAENGLSPADSVLGFDCADLEPERCELALLHLPRGRDLQNELLQAGGAMLRPGGRLAFVGAKNEGVRAALDEARRLYGTAGVVARKAGYHAALAYRQESEAIPLPVVDLEAHIVSVEGQPTALHSYPGAFARDRLDAGARALIEGMKISPAATVLDLGCGTGLVGLAALRQGGRVIGTDVSTRAVMSTHHTWAANGFPDAEVHVCIGATALPDASVDVVVTNPPFHKGHDVDFGVVQLFIEEAARVLRAGGVIYLVANAFLNYEPWLNECFSAITPVLDDRRFRVWRGYR